MGPPQAVAGTISPALTPIFRLRRPGVNVRSTRPNGVFTPWPGLRGGACCSPHQHLWPPATYGAMTLTWTVQSGDLPVLNWAWRALLWKDREESMMGNDREERARQGVTAELLATVNLGREIEGMTGLHLRMRRITLEPGGVFGSMHDHRGRQGRAPHPTSAATRPGRASRSTPPMLPPTFSARPMASFPLP